jgi:DNA-binding GntR family transcriptional regulator
MSIELEVPSLVDAVSRAMRKRILSGELAQGTAVTENAVATEYSVARPTAKAAVERLVHDGLLRRVANKTARVPVLGLDEVRDLYFSRGLIERSAMQALAGRGVVAESARSALDQFDAAAARSDLPQVVESDIAFHRALVDSLGSPRLSRLYVSLMGEFHLCMAQVQLHELLNPKTIATEHAAIVAAVEARDPERAVAEIDAHLHNASKRIVAFYGDAGDPAGN